MQWLLTRKVWLLNTRKVDIAHFLKKMDIVRFNSKPSIYTCINNALCNLNSGLGYKLAFYRYRYNITMSDDFELCIARISQCELSDHQLAIVNNCTWR